MEGAKKWRGQCGDKAGTLRGHFYMMKNNSYISFSKAFPPVGAADFVPAGVAWSCCSGCWRERTHGDSDARAIPWCPRTFRRCGDAAARPIHVIIVTRAKARRDWRPDKRRRSKPRAAHATAAFFMSTGCAWQHGASRFQPHAQRVRLPVWRSVWGTRKGAPVPSSGTPTRTDCLP